MTPLWYPSANLDAQFAHVGWGFLLVTVLNLVFGALWQTFAPKRLVPPSLEWALILTLAYAAAKEFGFDILVERDGFRNGAIDFSFYLVGAALATASIWGWRKLRG